MGVQEEHFEIFNTDYNILYLRQCESYCPQQTKVLCVVPKHNMQCIGNGIFGPSVRPVRESRGQ